MTSWPVDTSQSRGLGDQLICSLNHHYWIFTLPSYTALHFTLLSALDFNTTHPSSEVLSLCSAIKVLMIQYTGVGRAHWINTPSTSDTKLTAHTKLLKKLLNVLLLDSLYNRRGGVRLYCLLTYLRGLQSSE